MLINSLIGAQIVGIYIAEWETGTFNNADFIYLLSDGRCFRMPDFYLSITAFETCVPESRHQPARVFEEGDPFRRNLFGRSIVDILVPRDRELRTADAAAIKLASGYYMMQESGAPQGILPSVFLVEAIDEREMQSVFESEEWHAIKNSE